MALRATIDLVSAGTHQSEIVNGDLPRIERRGRSTESSRPTTQLSDPSTELVGDLDGSVAATDRAGTVALLDAAWRFGWAVGVGEHWHVAATEVAVRSRLVDDMPVVATAMRVPGGDVVQRAAAVRDASGRAVVLEFVNETQVPVSLALAVSGSIATARVRGSSLLADGRVALELDRAPGGAVAVDDGNVWEAVRHGPPAGDCEARSRSKLAAAAMLLPLATGVPLRATVPVGGGPVRMRLPEQVAAGWLAVVGRAASVELPDEAAERAWRRGIAASILAAGDTGVGAAARAAVVLDRVGLPDEADRARELFLRVAEGLSLSAVDAVNGLRALSSRRLRSGRVSGLDEWAGPLAAAAGSELDAFILERVAAVLEVEAPPAARDARRLLDMAASQPAARRPAAGGGDLAAAVRDAISFGGDGLAGIEALLDCLVVESADHLVVAPALPDEWRGAPLDVRDMATRHGLLSFSVRWHGTRPALLWDLQPLSGHTPASATLRCGLDDSWSSNALAGEALLGL